jgi:hypothetical protein
VKSARAVVAFVSVDGSVRSQPTDGTVAFCTDDVRLTGTRVCGGMRRSLIGWRRRSAASASIPPEDLYSHRVTDSA